MWARGIEVEVAASVRRLRTQARTGIGACARRATAAPSHHHLCAPCEPGSPLCVPAMVAGPATVKVTTLDDVGTTRPAASTTATCTSAASWQPDMRLAPTPSLMLSAMPATAPVVLRDIVTTGDAAPTLA